MYLAFLTHFYMAFVEPEIRTSGIPDLSLIKSSSRAEADYVFWAR